MTNAQTQTVLSNPEAAPPQIAVLPPPPPDTATQPTPSAPSAPETPATAPARKLSRNGKIARLPYLVRDMVNRMLRDNIPHSNIREALEEHGFTVTLRNISNWKTRGGYNEWCAEQDRALAHRLFQDNLLEHLRKQGATDLPEIGLQIAATNLSQFFLKSETQQQLATDPEKFARTVSTICRLSRHLHTLQRYRDEAAKSLGYQHNPERINRENLKDVEITREIYSAKSLGDRPGYIIPRRNYFPKDGYTPSEPD